ncbi:MAG: UvrD-helicase domain-containing protein [Sphaerochaetaceae bacterium]|nr:UvrD-helicase domain-containing protein [Sphaerochaetaceae bacterium]
MDKNDSVNLERLLSLQGTDPGFFVLAVHSFIEAFLRRYYNRLDDEDITFDALINEFREECIEKAKESHEYDQRIECLNSLKQSHILTNNVRHRFDRLNSEDARVATSLLQKFCLLSEINENEVLRKLNEFLSLWDERRPLGELWQELQRIYAMNRQVIAENGSLADQVANLTAEKDEIESLKAQKSELSKMMKKIQAEKEKTGERYDKLRKKNHELDQQLKKKETLIRQMKGVQTSLEILQRMTVYTRTRGDYERIIIRLTSEQEEVLNQITGNTDFLIKGHAGTGKTLVLLKAIEKIRGKGEQRHLEFETHSPSVLLLTYTNALVKYDKYITSILEPDEKERMIRTVDSFILETLKSFDPEITPDTKILPHLLEDIAIPGISSEDLLYEIEKFLWARDITRTEYIDEMIARTGMRKPLKRNDRVRVWKAKEEVEKKLNSSIKQPFSYIRYLLLRRLESFENDSIPRFDYLFVDEAQDLNATILKILKRMTKKALILAGDADQAIYQTGYAFNRAKIDITGKTRILKSNFRNSVEIHALAEHFRKTYLTSNEDSSFRCAFRDGPPVELVTETSDTRLLNQVAKQARFFIDYLHYDPENICIITVSKKIFKSVGNSLQMQNLSSCAVTDKDFTFPSEGKIRLNTIHSAKGLDFPVVLLFLPYQVEERKEYDEKVNRALFRNLIYVSISRAMEHLNIFAVDKDDSSVIGELIESYRATRDQV